MKMNKEITPQIIVLFENCNQLKLLAEETPDSQHIKIFAEQLYSGLNNLFLFQELKKIKPLLVQLRIKVIDFQANNSAKISLSIKEQLENIKINLVTFQHLIENE